MKRNQNRKEAWAMESEEKRILVVSVYEGEKNGTGLAQQDPALDRGCYPVKIEGGNWSWITVHVELKINPEGEVISTEYEKYADKTATLSGSF